jgi:hypothetical protein
LTSPSILITGARAPAAIDLARSFADAGNRVTLADSVRCRAAGWAGLGAVQPLPAPRGDLSGYAAALAAIIQSGQAEMILPTCEEVFHLAAAAERLGVADRVFAPSLEVLAQLHSKITFPALLAELGLPAPETFALDKRSDALTLDIPPDQLVLKPEFSRFGTAVLVRPTPSQLAQWAAAADAPTGRWCAQRAVAGEEICLWSAARGGHIVASCAYRPAWRNGASYAFEALDCPAALAVATRLAGALNLTGQISLDCILTPAGVAVPIECNPRATSGVHLFDGAPALAAAIMGAGPPVHCTTGLRFLSPAMLSMGIAHALTHGRLGDWRRDWQRGRDALTRPGQRLPALGALIDAMGFAARGALAGRSPSAHSTADIEWNGAPL